jgi:transposase-like protein
MLGGMKHDEGQATAKRKRRPSAEERARILADWAASGQTAGAMSAAADWSKSALYRWRTSQGELSLRKTDEPRPLVAVPAPIANSAVAEVLTRSAAVRLFATASPQWAAQLIRELNRC